MKMKMKVAVGAVIALAATGGLAPLRWRPLDRQVTLCPPERTHRAR